VFLGVLRQQSNVLSVLLPGCLQVLDISREQSEIHRRRFNAVVYIQFFSWLRR